ncbi:30S ribosome-binding factor RbfA [Rhodovulum sp. DZ06]|uniref:30S ribosome-binding factor RbfA n=1 Tax=Rhodovulum sp. DZ06 TaxID=3425126 RepID=UPI003D34DB70
MGKNKFGGASGPSQRQLKVGEEIRRALSGALLRGDIHDDTLARLSITVSEVRVSPDLRNATAFVLPLGGFEAEEALAALKRNKGELRRAIAKEVRLKYSPDLSFIRDDAYDRMDEARRLLNSDVVRADVEGRDGSDGASSPEGTKDD